MLPSASVWERALLPEGHRHLLLPKSGGLLLLASFRLVQRFLWISWSCLCMKSPSSQQWESSSSSPGLRAPSLFFWATSFSIVALWRRMESVHLCRTSPAGLR